MSETRSLRSLAELAGHDERAWSIAWNPIQPLLASCSSDKTVRLWSYTRPGTSSPGPASSDIEPAPDAPFAPSTYSFKPAGTIETGHSKTVRAVAWAPTGAALATASFDATVGIWEHPALSDNRLPEPGADGRWECASLLEGQENECKGVAYSHGGNLLATCSRDKTVWIWEVIPDGEFECAAVLMEHTQDVKAVAWHPREDILASASYDDTIHLYTDDDGADDWTSVCALKGHGSTVWALAFAPRGEHLASVSDDRTLRIWKRGGRGSRDRWAEVAKIDSAHERAIYSVAWTDAPDVEEHEGCRPLGWIATAGADGRINVYTASEKVEDEGPPAVQLVARIEQAHGDHDVNAVAWCPLSGSARVLASVGDDGYVRIWEV